MFLMHHLKQTFKHICLVENIILFFIYIIIYILYFFSLYLVVTVSILFIIFLLLPVFMLLFPLFLYYHSLLICLSNALLVVCITAVLPWNCWVKDSNSYNHRCQHFRSRRDYYSETMTTPQTERAFQLVGVDIRELLLTTQFSYKNGQALVISHCG